jgi:type IV secretion system protein VirB3
LAASLDHATVFVALTRPQMFAGVTYSYFVANMILAAEVFLITKSIWTMLVAALLHVVGVLLCLREPRIFDLWLVRVSRCPRIRNYALWGCNSYRP